MITNHKTRIAVAEPSFIIRSGIIATLKRFTSLSIEVYEISEMENLELLLMTHTPDLLIVNPVCMDSHTLSLFKRNPRLQAIKYIALQTSVINISLLKHFDQIISIMHNVEQIREIVYKLIISSDNEDTQALSEREKDIITSIAEGLTNKEIAYKLHISINTVMTHRKNISKKLNIHSTAGLILYAVANHLIETN
ncbi:MAG: response regulator transcription factor [Bacteroidales bacterium]|jgi:DNA-binding NarL/FixJ family response regulator|nr:response regulator transcription factor [Bacteroidales bacterium]